MNRISRCLRYQMRNMIKSNIYFAGIYLLVCIGFLALAISNENTTVSTYSGFNFGAAIFAFVYVASDYRTSFNYLMINSNTRRTIFFSSALSNIALSFMLTILSYIFGAIDTLITKTYSNSGYSSVELLQVIYPGSSTTSVLLFITALFIMITAFGMLYGALVYRFGKYFITLYWVCFGLIFITTPFTPGTPNIISFFETFLCIGKTNGILLAPINFIIAAAVFSTAAYLISSRQPQTAPAQ